MPPRRVRRQVLVRLDQQIAIRPVLVPPDPSAQLMQIGQTVAIGLVDKDRVGVGNVEAALDDRRRKQEVELVFDESDHHLFQFVIRHLGVPDPEPRSYAEQRTGPT